MKFKRLYIICLFLLPLKSLSQNFSHEIGLFAGTSYYMGDLNSQNVFFQLGPAVGALYKFNFNPRYAFRIGATYTELRGSDSKSKNLYQQTRDHSFHTPLVELSSILEFNFFPYIPEGRYEFLSPYVFVGAGALAMPAANNPVSIQGVIPFGIGVKYAINHRLGLSAEWSYRKTFTDYIDQLSENEYTETPSLVNKQKSFSSGKDWYSFAGISLTYKFALGKTRCPAYGR
jgi:hypothetical protein